MRQISGKMQTESRRSLGGLEVKKIEKPEVSTVDSSQALRKFLAVENGNQFVKEANEPDYLSWSKVQYKRLPPGMEAKEFWVILKKVRQMLSVPTPIKAENGTFFSWVRTPGVEESLHTIDMHTGGQMFASYEMISERTKQKFVSRGIIEEAIASSQLEGATTTRAVAKKVILENRAPRNESEVMIVNNYHTMKLIEEEYKQQSLTNELLFEMHRQLTRNEIDPSEQMRYRKEKDNIVIANATHITHIPPNEAFFRQELLRVFRYANDEDTHGFLHPVIKAIFIHFWIGYLHPFTDGNGRLARSLFYWYLLKKGYWTFLYLPLSTMIRNSPDAYAQAYLLSEQDDLDITYFFDYHLKKILRAVASFEKYLEQTVRENREVEVLLGKQFRLNERQKQVIHHLLAEGSHAYVTTNMHKTMNRVSRLTARKDLLALQKKQLLSLEKVGKNNRYYPTQKLVAMKKHWIS